MENNSQPDDGERPRKLPDSRGDVAQHEDGLQVSDAGLGGRTPAGIADGGLTPANI